MVIELFDTAVSGCRCAATAPQTPVTVAVINSSACPTEPAAEELLRSRGIGLLHYPDAAAALLCLLQVPPAAIVVPTDVIGVEYLHLVRTIAQTGILVLAGHTGQDESSAAAFQALEMGAAALIGLPVAAVELTTALRRRGVYPPPVAVETPFRGVTLDRDERQLVLAGAHLDLSGQDYALLDIFLRSESRVVTVAEIATLLHDDSPRHSRARKAVERLRHRLTEITPTTPPAVETVRGLGYRLVDPPAVPARRAAPNNGP